MTAPLQMCAAVYLPPVPAPSFAAYSSLESATSHVIKPGSLGCALMTKSWQAFATSSLSQQQRQHATASLASVLSVCANANTAPAQRAASTTDAIMLVAHGRRAFNKLLRQNVESASVSCSAEQHYGRSDALSP